VNVETVTATPHSKAQRQRDLVITVAGDSIHEMLFRGPSALLSWPESN
jgi:hypothetical protein